MKRNVARELAKALADRVEDVCRYYLPSGVRAGAYWCVGDISGSEGRSLQVRLVEGSRAPVGYWIDQNPAGDGHGDLLDLIRLNRGLPGVPEAIAEARAFLKLPVLPPLPAFQRQGGGAAGSAGSASQKLWRLCKKVDGSHAAAYLASRGLAGPYPEAIRFHPSLFVHVNPGDTTSSQYPGLVGAVTDPNYKIVGLQRYFLDPDSPAKAKFDEPKRSMGACDGNAVRFSPFHPIQLVGEGIENSLTVRHCIGSGWNIGAAGTANHMSRFVFTPGTEWVVSLEDADDAGAAAGKILAERATAAGMKSLRIPSPQGAGYDDFNGALKYLGRERLAQWIFSRLDAAGIPRR